MGCCGGRVASLGSKTLDAAGYRGEGRDWLILKYTYNFICLLLPLYGLSTEIEVQL